MPLGIDITFKWGKKKTEEKKDPTTTSGSTTTTTCSTATKTDGATTPTTVDTSSTGTTASESSKFHTLETGTKSLSNTSETDISKTSETTKTKTSSKDGSAVDTVDDSNEDDKTQCNSASQTKTTTSATTDTSSASTTTKSGKQVNELQPESTQADSSATSIEDEKKNMKTLKKTEPLKPEIKKSKVETSSKESDTESTETSETEPPSTASTQGTEDDGKKLKVLNKKQKPESVLQLAEKSTSAQRRVILFRHAERMDRVFPSWIRQSNSNGTFRPYNSNHPKTLPKRRGGLTAYDSDPPITEIGKIVAQLAGKSLKRSQLKISAIYSSPAFRCIETAQILTKESGIPDLKIKIEPGLFDWCNFYESSPTFFTTTELLDSGIAVAKNYRPIISKESLYKDFFGSETKFDFYRRSHDIIHKILASTLGTVIIVGHATTIDSTSRALLELPKSIPSILHLDRLADRYPYCTSVALEQSSQNGQWRLGKSLLPITFLNQTTKFDKQFLLRK